MWTYIIRRFIQALFILLIITAVVFLLTRLSADPMSQYANKQGMTAADRAAIAHKLGLDITLPRSAVAWMHLPQKTEDAVIKASGIPVQYFKWLGLALQGDLGNSFFSRQPVSLLRGAYPGHENTWHLTGNNLATGAKAFEAAMVWEKQNGKS